MTDNDWTVHTLKALIETELRERDRRWESEQRAIAEALRKAEEANERRLDLLNEFRQQTVDEQGRFVTRIEFEALKERYSETAEALRLVNAKVMPIIWVGAAIIVASIGVFISHVTTGSP